MKRTINNRICLVFVILTDALGSATTPGGGVTDYRDGGASRLISVTQPNGETVSYTYDGRGNRAAMTSPDGKTVKYVYDEMDRLVSVKGVDGKTTRYSYDALGRRTATDGAKEDTTYAYDEVGNLVSQTTTGAYDLALSYAYDLSGRMTQESRTENGTTLTSAFTYDALGQLTGFTRSDGLSESYVYDPVGNMTAKTKNGVKTQYSYNAANQLVQSVTSGDTTKYSYDANGNLVKSENAGGARSYVYNALGLLVQFTREDGYSETYSYNANRLLSSITDHEGTTTLTWDILQGEGVVIGAAQNGETTSYTYGLERISAITGKTRTEYVYDGRGSVAAELSYNDSWYTFGGVLAKKSVTVKSYTPFGEQIGEAVSGYGYNGEYYNAATGMVYLRARFYAPELNRFGQKDLLRGSVTQPGSLNRYAYVQNDPMNYIDPSGEALKSIISRAVNTVVSKVTSSPTVQKAVSVARKVIAPVAKAVTTVAQKVAATSVGKAVSAVVQKTATVKQAVTTTAGTATRQVAQSAAAQAATLRAKTQVGGTGTQLPQNADVSLWPEDYYSKFPSVTIPSVAEMMDNIYYCQQKRTEEANERLAEYNRQEASAIAGAQEYRDTMIFNPNKEDLKYQDGPNGTTGIGFEASAALLVRVSVGIQVVWDNKGNVGLQKYATIGAGSPSLSAGFTLTTTDAETIADLQSWGESVGGSVLIISGEDISGDGYGGTTLSFGKGWIDAEIHKELTYSSITVLNPKAPAFVS